MSYMCRRLKPDTTEGLTCRNGFAGGPKLTIRLRRKRGCESVPEHLKGGSEKGGADGGKLGKLFCSASLKFISFDKTQLLQTFTDRCEVRQTCMRQTQTDKMKMMGRVRD